MYFLNLLKNFIPLRWRRVGRDEPLSMVLLLRKPHFFEAGALRLAAERAWHTSFAGGGGSSTRVVVQSGTTTMMKAGPHVLNFFHYAQPYIENPQDNISWLRQASQQRAWAEHRACVAVDYLNPETDLELAYCVLAKLVAEMIDENCSALYVPRQSSLIPNDETLHLELHKITSARDAGIAPTPAS